MTAQVSHHPHARVAVQLCDALRKLPGVGHERADRLQGILLNPHNTVVLNRTAGVVKSCIPHLGQTEAVLKLAQALRQHHSGAADHTYQTTLRRWQDEHQ